MFNLAKLPFQNCIVKCLTRSVWETDGLFNCWFFKKSLKQINSLFECRFAWNILKGIHVNVWINVFTTPLLLLRQSYKQLKKSLNITAFNMALLLLTSSKRIVILSSYIFVTGIYVCFFHETLWVLEDCKASHIPCCTERKYRKRRKRS